jgi:hypothetical protein
VSVSTYTSEKSKTGGTCDVIVWDWQTGKIVARTRLDWPVHEGDMKPFLCQWLMAWRMRFSLS